MGIPLLLLLSYCWALVLTSPCSFLQNSNYNGTLLLKLPSVSPSTCCQSCQNTLKCVAGVHYQSHCYILAKNSDMASDLVFKSQGHTTCLVEQILSKRIVRDEFTPFDTSEPTWPHVSHPLQPTSFWSPSLKAPYPTNTWWINAVLDNGDNLVAPQPYSTWLKTNGLLVAYPPKIIGNNGQYLSKWYNNGIYLGFQGSGTHQVVAYDDMSVTAQYILGSQSVTYPLVRGSPYISAEYNNGLLPVLTFDKCTLVSVNGVSAPGSVKGTRFELQLSTSERWILYLSSAGMFTWTTTSFYTSSSPSGSWTLRLALSPSTSDDAILDQYYECVPIGGDVSASFTDTAAQMSITFTTTGTCDQGLLMTAQPHMIDVITQPSTALTYDGLTGSLVGVVGTTWTWTETFLDINWYAPRPIASNRQADILAQLQVDLKFTGMAPDTYGFGKDACRIARLALIAEELNQPDLAEQARTTLISAFEPWLDGTGTDAVMFDTTWFGTPPRVGLQDKTQDFGAGYYNDHHFHFGYWLYAAAVLAKGNSSWASAHKEKFVSLARDIANPSSSDPFFPKFRHTDFFAGHSWAAGLFTFSDGRNQESSSEAQNAWYGLALFGNAIGDSNIEGVGKMLLAHELRGTKRYWHSTNAQSVYPEGFAKSKCVGMVWSDKVDTNTWFGAGAVFGHGINMLPFTPISEFYLTKDWVTEEYPVVLSAITSTTTDSWKGFIYMDHAVIDANTAWTEIQTLKTFDDGNSMTNAMWWISTRP